MEEGSKRLLKCSKCKREFTSAKGLSNHLRSNCGTKSLIEKWCAYCSESFMIQRSKLKVATKGKFCSMKCRQNYYNDRRK